MNREQALTELKEILATNPDNRPEPEKRDAYWHLAQRQASHEWRNRLTQWHDNCLKAVYNPDAQTIHVELLGKAIPETCLSLRNDGSVEFRPFTDDPDDPPPYGWVPPLELPKKGQDLAKFQKKNASRNDHNVRWGLSHRASMMLRELLQDDTDLTQKEKAIACNLSESATAAEVRWIARVRGILDPDIMPRLKKWAGQEIKQNLQNYNLSVLAADALQETARVNPPALVWWMRERARYNDLSERQQHSYHNPDEPKPPWASIPQHPEEIISQVKQWFLEAGGTCWEAFARQPASHILELLKKEGQESAVWVSDILDLSSLPPENSGSKTPNPQLAQTSLFPEAENTAPAKQCQPQPPLQIKLMMAALAKRTSAPGEEHDRRRRSLGMDRLLPILRSHDETTAKAMNNMALLAFQEYADQELQRGDDAKELTKLFNRIADYIFDEPEAAACALSWQELNQAADKWRDEASLRAECENLKETVNRFRNLKEMEWESPITRWTSPSGVTAVLLNSPSKLIAEAELMRHWTATMENLQYCNAGKSHIFRLEPGNPPADETERQQWLKDNATAVELTVDERGRWFIYEHTGYRRRLPTYREKWWAEDLLEQWNRVSPQPETAPTQPELIRATDKPNAWQHTIGILPQEAVDAMDRFYQETGIDHQEQHAFVCNATKHQIAVKWMGQNAWTADQDKWLEDLANDLYRNYMALILRNMDKDKPIDQSAAAAALRAAEAIFEALNANPLAPGQAEQAQQAFEKTVMDNYAASPRPQREDPAELRKHYIERYLEDLKDPDHLSDDWAICSHNAGTPDFYCHAVPNPIPPDDRPEAYARFQTTDFNAEWPADDGGVISYCPCRTCRADLEDRAAGRE